MITEVNERRVSVDIPSVFGTFEATVRDGVVISLTNLPDNPDTEHIVAYQEFLKEVLQAIKETERE